MAQIPSLLGATNADPTMMLVRGGFLGAMVALEVVEIATAALSHLDSTAAMTFLALNLTAGGAAGFTRRPAWLYLRRTKDVCRREASGWWCARQRIADQHQSGANFRLVDANPGRCRAH
jgi:hypothetical protein